VHENKRPPIDPDRDVRPFRQLLEACWQAAPREWPDFPQIGMDLDGIRAAYYLGSCSATLDTWLRNFSRKRIADISIEGKFKVNFLLIFSSPPKF
jgi:hypothetical protein